MGRFMGVEKSNMQIKMNIKGNSGMGRGKEKGSIYIEMDQSMKADLLMIEKKGKIV